MEVRSQLMDADADVNVLYYTVGLSLISGFCIPKNMQSPKDGFHWGYTVFESPSENKAKLSLA